MTGFRRAAPLAFLILWPGGRCNMRWALRRGRRWQRQRKAPGSTGSLGPIAVLAWMVLDKPRRARALARLALSAPGVYIVTRRTG